MSNLVSFVWNRWFYILNIWAEYYIAIVVTLRQICFAQFLWLVILRFTVQNWKKNTDFTQNHENWNCGFALGLWFCLSAKFFHRLIGLFIGTKWLVNYQNRMCSSCMKIILLWRQQQLFFKLFAEKNVSHLQSNNFANVEL